MAIAGLSNNTESFMNKALQIFNKDHANLRVHKTFELHIGNQKIGGILGNLSFDFDAGVKYASLYVPETPLAAQIIADFARDIEKIRSIEDDVAVFSSFMGTKEQIASASLVFSPRLLVYTPTWIDESIQAELEAFARKQGISLVIREGFYLKQRIDIEKPMAFISHDSRDKETFVKELASKLHEMMCTVWYDEYALVPGASLRECIETGLKNCKKCVIVLSPHFLSNGGWTKAEFDSIYAREILENSKVFIPIWHNVTKREVYEYCPRLVDRVGIKTNQDIGEIAKQVLRRIRA